MTIDEAMLYFYIYSFLGWVYESILVSVREKRWANRGFLIGPICPIYGAGGLLFALMGTHLSVPLTFLVCMVSSAVLEYLTVQKGVAHVTAWCASENIASKRTLEKAGMRLSGIDAGGLEVGGQRYDKLDYTYSDQESE